MPIGKFQRRLAWAPPFGSPSAFAWHTIDVAEVAFACGEKRIFSVRHDVIKIAKQCDNLLSVKSEVSQEAIRQLGDHDRSELRQGPGCSLKHEAFCTFDVDLQNGWFQSMLIDKIIDRADWRSTAVRSRTGDCRMTQLSD